MQAPIARAFESTGIYAANHVIGVGALFGLLATAVGRLYHPPRILLAMSKDGLMPAFLGKVCMFIFHKDKPWIVRKLCIELILQAAHKTDVTQYTVTSV